MLREGLWVRDPTEGLKKQRTPRKRPTVLGIGEVRALFELAALRSEPLRSRDLAIVAVLSQSGLRVNELCDLNLDQFDRYSSQLVRVLGKGGTVHDVVLNGAATFLVGRWLDVRPIVATATEEALFVNAHGHRLRPRAIQRLFVAWRGKLGTAKKISPHTLRHTMGTLAYANGTDIALVGNLLRHSDVNTTMIYIHCVDDGRRAAVARLQSSVPSHLIAAQSNEIAPGEIISHLLAAPIANTVDVQAQLYVEDSESEAA
jgi:site-specific recombinase XerC